jgi:hypothetical protein
MHHPLFQSNFFSKIIPKVDMNFSKNIIYNPSVNTKQVTPRVGSMDNKNVKLFENKRVRTAWDEEKEEWLFSIVDVVGVLTDQPTPRNASTYWAVMKNRLKDEGLMSCLQIVSN